MSARDFVALFASRLVTGVVISALLALARTCQAELETERQMT